MEEEELCHLLRHETAQTSATNDELRSELAERDAKLSKKADEDKAAEASVHEDQDVELTQAVEANIVKEELKLELAKWDTKLLAQDVKLHEELLEVSTAAAVACKDQESKLAQEASDCQYAFDEAEKIGALNEKLRSEMAERDAQLREEVREVSAAAA